jgi:hypothetical protein
MLERGGEVRVTVTFEGYITGGPADTLAEHLDAVMEELVDLGAADPAVGARLDANEVEVSVSVEADTLDEAQTTGNSMIRSAIHAAGGSTPDWRIDWTATRTHHALAPAKASD